MRKSYTVLCLAFFVGSIQAQTTLEEYNYVIKGYKIQVESGLDMKKGYELKDLFEIPMFEFEKKAKEAATETGVRPSVGFSSNERKPQKPEEKLVAKGLYRTGQTSPCAIMVLVTRGTVIEIVKCIPHQDSNDVVWGLYYMSLQDVQDARLMAAAAGHCAAYFAKNN